MVRAVDGLFPVRGIRSISSQFSEFIEWGFTLRQKRLLDPKRIGLNERTTSRTLSSHPYPHIRRLSEIRLMELFKQTPFQSKVLPVFSKLSGMYFQTGIEGIEESGSMLKAFADFANKALYDEKKSPVEIVESFLRNHFNSQEINSEQKLTFIAGVRQWIERQVAIFEATEDSLFEKIHNLDGTGTIQHLIEVCTRNGLVDELKQAFQDHSVTVVLTAHPTNYKRRLLSQKLLELEDAIRHENVQAQKDIIYELANAKFREPRVPIDSSDPERKVIKPITAEDEVSNLIEVLKNYYFALGDAQFKINSFLSEQKETLRLETNYKLGFWPGGDRDGNKKVTHEVTLFTGEKLRDTVLDLYIQDLTLSRGPEDRSLKSLLTHREIELPFSEVERKLEKTKAKTKEGYSSSDLFMNDLLELRELVLKHDPRLHVIEKLDKLITRVKLFGFHFAPMDIRQSRMEHEKAFKDLFNVPECTGNNQRRKLLQEYASGETNHQFDLSTLKDGTQELIKTFEVIRTIQSENGEKGCCRYIISNADSADNVLEVLAFARASNLTRNNMVPLDVIPLFEKMKDLNDAEQTMRDLFDIDVYKEHLKGRGNIQYVMLGFSDGTKDCGFLMANWAIRKAKEKLTKLAKEKGIKIIFFDGRGGPPSRGGGPTYHFYRALGKNIASNNIQLTLQGGSIWQNPASIIYNFGQLLSASIENTLSDIDQCSRCQDISSSPSTKTEDRDIFKPAELSEEEKDILDFLATKNYEKYYELVGGDSELSQPFLDFIDKVTPFRYLNFANVASRALRREASKDLEFEDLRAITFVASLALMKLNIGAYYGVGTALNEFLKSGQRATQMDKLQKLYKTCPYFKALIGSSMQSLQKTNLEITRYLDNDPTYGTLWKKFEEETVLTRDLFLEITESEQLMSDNPSSRESVLAREELVLPLNIIQQYMLIELRKRFPGTSPNQTLDLKSIFDPDPNKGVSQIDPESERFAKELLASLNAIVIAARNSI